MATPGEILVVDDDARMRELIVKVLAREGYAVRSLPRGQEVLQALEDGPVDLVISDIRMPEMDGLTLLQEVKRVAPETSVLMMTAFGSIDTAVQAIKAGAYDHLTEGSRHFMSRASCGKMGLFLAERRVPWLQPAPPVSFRANGCAKRVGISSNFSMPLSSHCSNGMAPEGRHSCILNG
jgi:CheY-like chemotaxis protein